METRYYFAKFQAEDPFTRIPRGLIRDPNLDLKARGLLLVMLDKPVDWRFTERNLADECGVGREQLRSAMSTLIDAGYVRRVRVPGPGSLPPRVITQVTDTANRWPDDPEGRETQPSAGGRVAQGPETRPHKNKGGTNECEVQEHPLTADAARGHVHEGNGQSQQVNGTSPANAPEQPRLLILDGVEAHADEQRPASDAEFDWFWEHYPRHHLTSRPGGGGSRRKAFSRWRRMTSTQRAAAMVGVENYAAFVAASGTYPKHAETWLNQQTWEDWQEPAEVTAPPAPERPLTAVEKRFGVGYR